VAETFSWIDLKRRTTGAPERPQDHAKQAAHPKFHCRHGSAAWPPALAIGIHLALENLPAFRFAILP